MAERVVRPGRPLVGGIIMLGLGIYLQLMAFELVPAIDSSWPIILILIGVAFIVRGITRR